jgi:hypothetical protein
MWKRFEAYTGPVKNVGGVPLVGRSCSVGNSWNAAHSLRLAAGVHSRRAGREASRIRQQAIDLGAPF